jgi:hypothetical protein
MEIIYSTKRNVTPAKAIEILAQNGTKVTVEEAKIIWILCINSVN